ncbi:MAG: DinB family protein [Bryobacteraceae bacterium]
MYTSVEEFLRDWAYESEATLKVLSVLTDESLEQRITPEGRSLGRLAWHIVLTPSEMLFRAGLEVQGPVAHAAQPADADEFGFAYQHTAASVESMVKDHWTDDTLQQEANMYGQVWKKGVVLGAMIFHQCHHRGQMTVLMRQAGLKVPGIYGPAAEEWAAFGMPVPD